jgi:hypothetical protein
MFLARGKVGLFRVDSEAARGRVVGSASAGAPRRGQPGPQDSATALFVMVECRLRVVESCSSQPSDALPG